MKDNNLVNITPTLFDKNTIMIGRSKTEMVWKKFQWGATTDLNWEYAPLTHLNKHLVGTTKPYFEIDDEMDNVVNETQNDINKVVETVDGLSDTQVGVCALYSVYKYATLIKRSNFVLADNYRNVVVSIMNNEDYKKFIEMNKQES